MNGALKFDDIRNYNVELIIPDNSNQSINILAGYIVAGKLGALAGSVTKPCYLILRKKDFQSFKDPVKHVIYGEKSIETLYNLLVFFQEKGYIE